MKKAINTAHSAATPKQAWAGKDIELTLIGRKQVNSTALKEIYNMTIESVSGSVSLADAIREALKIVEEKTSIPADLVEGLEFKFIPSSATMTL